MGIMSIMGTEGQLRIALKGVPPKQLPEGIKGGDAKLIWSRSNADEVESVRRTFDDLKKKGFAAFSVDSKGEKGKQIFNFDSEAEKLIMVPPLRGGAE